MKKLTALLLIALTLIGLTACYDPPCDHKWVYYGTIEATCTENKQEIKECSLCGEYQYTYFDDTKLGHEYENEVCVRCGSDDPPATLREGLLVFHKDEEGYSVAMSGGRAQGRMVIPERLFGLPVVTIRENAFKGQTEMTEIVIPDSIVTIEDSAFEGCTGLTSVTLGKGVKRIQERVFYGCTNLSEVYMSASVDRIGYDTFAACGRLQKMVLPFVGCAKYDSISYGASFVFGHLFGSEYYAGAQKVVARERPDATRKDYTYYIPASLSSVEILGGSLHDGAFHNCTMIKELILPSHITETGRYALEGLTGLEKLIAPGLRGYHTSLDMPSLVELDSPIDFSSTGMPNLQKLTWRNVTEQSDLSRVTRYQKLTDLTIVFADDVKKVKLETLTPVLDKLMSLELTSPATEVDQGVFSALTALKKAAVPYSVLGELSMKQLKELTILSDSAYRIPRTLFASATQLERLTLDSHVTGFEEYAFEHCIALKNVTLDGRSEALTHEQLVACWLQLSFEGEKSNPLSHGAALAFVGEDGTHTAEVLALPSDMTDIGAYVFDGCNNLVTLMVGEGIVCVGTHAFRHTTALETVRFAGTLAAWCAIDFANAEANPINGAGALMIDEKILTAWDEKVTVESISAYAFYGYEGLKTLSIPEGLTHIGTFAFFGCAGLTEVSLSATLTRIDARVFEACMALTAVRFADAANWAHFENSSVMVGVPIEATVLGNAAEAASHLVTLYPDHIFKKVG